MIRRPVGKTVLDLVDRWLMENLKNRARERGGVTVRQELKEAMNEARQKVDDEKQRRGSSALMMDDSMRVFWRLAAAAEIRTSTGFRRS
jgi:hypothetical protein